MIPLIPTVSAFLGGLVAKEVLFPAATPPTRVVTQYVPAATPASAWEPERPAMAYDGTESGFGRPSQPLAAPRANLAAALNAGVSRAAWFGEGQGMRDAYWGACLLSKTEAGVSYRGPAWTNAQLTRMFGLATREQFAAYAAARASAFAAGVADGCAALRAKMLARGDMLANTSLEQASARGWH